MKIAGVFSFNKGKEVLSSRYPDLLEEIYHVIESINARSCRKKRSKEKTMPGRLLYSPVKLNKLFKQKFYENKWETIRVPCDYPTKYYVPGYKPDRLNKGSFREMDFVKQKIGIEVQFGKYAFMVYNVAAKMTIFRNLGYINAGVEIVPVKKLANEMSTGVSYFEQFVWDLEKRGVANIDVPVLILGVDPES